MDDRVITTVEDGVATLAMNRPDALNALDTAMAEALAAALARCEADPAVRCVVLSTSGDHFMAGGDIRQFQALLAEPEALRRAMVERLIQLAHLSVLAVRRMPKPVLAGVKGACAGFGLSLVLACDLAVASDDAYFTLAYAGVGASPDGGSTFHLPRAVGLRKAMEIALLPDRIGAADAASLGLVNRVVLSGHLDDETRRLARRLADGPTAAFARTKALMNESFGRELPSQLQAEAEAFAASSGTADFREGVEAFLARRPAAFRGG
jgi:2-(1,2-epoxy-1,2-dihydrophenyl)acetyl-CoA isomerase